jgi:hypothetical protein
VWQKSQTRGLIEGAGRGRADEGEIGEQAETGEWEAEETARDIEGGLRVPWEDDGKGADRGVGADGGEQGFKEEGKEAGICAIWKEETTMINNHL